MAVPYKLHVKLGESEFSGEGPEASIKADYDKFLSAASTKPAGPPRSPSPSGNGSAIPPDSGQIDETILKRVFAVDDNGGVSLRLLPRSDRRDADALVALLYGFRKLSDQSDIGSGTLMAAAKTSGLQLTRIDTVLAAYRHLVTEGGYRRGKRYGLNNQGIAHAEQVIAGMM
jgi:hypothetical protein